ncbi:histone deacetylase family protein [Siculibacillus lacustris]|uniref:Histone deacetylase family protein n=1 Tax=Siculibacillus lacustris TaxID=1549641 RepID=A0A4Q9VJC3_9HYPH|nr:histone deacetylase family protein [Siculibacillus lacustris]TBW34504.1 histone deacetylase family protein [Siculibacillus lacustris]
MSTLLIHHPACLGHVTPLGHPERPDRIRVIDRILEAERFQPLEREAAALGTAEMVGLAHDVGHFEEIAGSVPSEGLLRLDDDTTISPGSLEAALRAVGGACQAVDEVFEKKVKNAFCTVRPPGHHAESKRAMGFCLFNNAAIAAKWARARHGAERVVVMDFDVHHGNGTQDIFWNERDLMYASTHQMPFYPGTGEIAETGIADNIVNAPLWAGAGGAEFREAMDFAILPRIDAFRPDLVVISAGFDAHTRDPMSQINLVESDFAWATARLMDLAERHCNGRVVSILEGGYDLEGLARSVAAHVMTLMKS